MVDFIASESKKIIFNCIERESKKYGIPLGDTRLKLSLNNDGSNSYSLIKEIERNGVKDIETVVFFNDFKDVLGVKIDFKGYSLVAPPFVQKALIRFADNLKIPFTKINALCYPTYQKGEIAICLFNEKSYIKQITINELINEEDATMPQ